MLVVSDSAIKVQFLKDGCNLCLLFLMQQGGGYCERSLFDRQMLLIMLLEGFESNDEQSLIGLWSSSNHILKETNYVAKFDLNSTNCVLSWASIRRAINEGWEEYYWRYDKVDGETKKHPPNIKGTQCQ